MCSEDSNACDLLYCQELFEVRVKSWKNEKFWRLTFFRLSSSIFALFDFDLSDQQITSSKHGSLLTVQCVNEFKIGMEQFQKIIDAESKKRTNDLSVVDKNEFARLLRKRSFRAILENRRNLKMFRSIWKSLKLKNTCSFLWWYALGYQSHFSPIPRKLDWINLNM